jgi:hypothetical protein
MIVEIEGKCGHKFEKDILNSSREEPGPRSLKKSVEYWSGLVCRDCFIAEKKAETSTSLEQFGELLELVGSEKQVTWAVSLREKRLVNVSEWIAKLETVRNALAEAHPDDHLVEDEVLAGCRARVALLATITDAKFWIDTREEEVWVLFGEGAGANYRVRFDLEASKVTLGQRGKPKEILTRSGRYIMVGGTKFYDREVS